VSKRRAIAEALRSLQTEYFSSRYRECIVEDHAWVVSLSRDGRLDETIFSQLYRSFADGLRLVAFFNTRPARHQPPGAPILRQAYRVKPSSRSGTATEPTHRQERAKVVSSSRDSILARKMTDLNRTLQLPIGHLNAETQSHGNETPRSHLPTISQQYRAGKQYLAKRTERNRRWHGACSEAANAKQYAL
jgi:hypothetical protein